MCGLIGLIKKSGNAIDDGIVLLSAENNRGEQCCGAAIFDGKKIIRYCGEGLVKQVFGNKKKVAKLTGSALIMHTLYSTVDPAPGETVQPKTQHPLLFNFRGRVGALAHNGNLVGLEQYKKQAEKDGYVFCSPTSDTEVIAAMLCTSKKKDFIEALVEVSQKIENNGAFSLAILFKGKIIGVRCGIKPLCIGKKHGKNGDSNSYILASESCVFSTLEATRMLREVEPGELVVLGPDGQEKSVKWGSRARHGLCSCEFIYFAKPGSVFCGITVSRFRRKAGEIAARNHPVKADIIVPIPNSGRHYSDGFAAQSGTPTRDAFEKNYYGPKNRTFIEERGTDRRSRMRERLSAIPNEMQSMAVCLTEDSVFRGSVLPPVVKMAREYGGAREVHVRVCSPPVCHRCHLGTDTRTNEELVAFCMETEKINETVVHADSLEYLTVEEFKQAFRELGLNPDDFCFGCFTGEYPVNPPPEK